MRRVALLIDTQCGLCRRTARILRSLDWLGRLIFADVHNAEDRKILALEIPESQLLHSMHMRFKSGVVLSGFPAFRRMCWHIPLLWIVAPVLYLPGVRGIGEWIYEKIAAARRCRWNLG